jgi:threonine aldolase
MNFLSDNAEAAAPEMLEALRLANEGAAIPYGEDSLTVRLQAEMARVFEHEIALFPVVSGTAANALALAELVPAHGAILCHRGAHIAIDECGAPEFFTHGAKVVTVDGPDGKLLPNAVEGALEQFSKGSVHHAQPAALSITQASESGTCYRPEEIGALSSLAARHGLKLHMDGARFANAIAWLGCTPAEASWRAGVDVLSFGATKNGALAAEAVVFFNPHAFGDFAYRRKMSGHLLSKMRFVSAQLLCALAENRWLLWAERANAAAGRLASRLKSIAGAEIVHPVEANIVFARLPETTIARMRAKGAKFYDWSPPAAGRMLVRLVTSLATTDADIEGLIEAARD